jgi:hypothetical protein
MMKTSKFKVTFVLLLVSLLISTLSCHSRWNSWLRNAPEEKYQVPSIQDRVVITPGEDASSERQISWRCGTKLSAAYIVLREKNNNNYQKITAHGTIVVTRGGKAAYYSVSLTHLKSNAEYIYQLVNGKMYSSSYSFKIPSANNNLSFIFIGDIQQEESDSSFYQLKNIYHSYPNINFFAFCGDIIEHPSDKYWNYWFNMVDSISPSVPMIVATGNHEYIKGFYQQLDARWEHTFVYPQNGPNNLYHDYYIDYPQLRMIVIDSQSINNIYSLITHYNWLNNVLKKAGNKWKIIMMHHPIYSTKKGRDNYFLRTAFRPLFEKYGVQLILQGHDHSYARRSTKKNGHGIPMYIISVCSPKHYNINKPKEFDRIGENLNLYQYIKIEGDLLKYKAFLIDSNKMYDHFCMTRKGVIIETAK